MASISNNSNIPLASGATFNGLYELLSAGAESVQISVKSDEPGVLRVFFAITPLVLLYEKSYTYTAGQYFFVSVPKVAQYFRCNFTNAGSSTQTYFELRTTFNNYLLVDEPTGAIVQVSNFPSVQDVSVIGTVPVSIATSLNSHSYGSPDNGTNWEPLKTNSGVLDVSDSTTHGALGSMLTELISINNEILNPTAVQVITGTVFSQGQGSPDGGTTWEPIKTTSGAQNVVIDSGSVSVSGVVDTSGSSISVSNFPTTQPVSIAGTVPVSGTVGISGTVDTSGSSVSVSSVAGSVSVVNATGSEIAVKKPDPVAFSVYSGAIALVGVYGSVDLNGYSSFDLLVYQPGGSVSIAGSLYVMVSNDAVNWFLNQSYSLYINTNPSDIRYMTTYPSLNCRYVAVTAENPFGGSGLTTTNSVITLSAKK